MSEEWQITTLEELRKRAIDETLPLVERIEAVVTRLWCLIEIREVDDE